MKQPRKNRIPVKGWDLVYMVHKNAPPQVKLTNMPYGICKTKKNILESLPDSNTKSFYKIVPTK